MVVKKGVKAMKISTAQLDRRQAELGLTRKAVAELAGISRQTMSAIAQRGTCEPITLGKIAKALGVDPADLIKED